MWFEAEMRRCRSGWNVRAQAFESCARGRELRAWLRLRMPHVTPLRWKRTQWKMMRAVGVPAVGEDLEVVGVAHGGMNQVGSVRRTILSL